MSATRDRPPADALHDEAGSFRDPHSRVVRSGGRVLRILSEHGLADFEALEASALWAEALRDGLVPQTRRVDAAGVADELRGLQPAAVLEHEPVPFVSYPYEWCFGMLRDAALLHLDLLGRALEQELMLKDATPYNVQWRGVAPVFVDVGSFERLRAGEPWPGYRQFCRELLYPLLLRAYGGIPFRPWLRGSLDGISADDCRRVLRLRDRLRPSVWKHVSLHARLERRYADTDRELRRDLREAGFDRRLIAANVRGLERLVRALTWDAGSSEWSGYTTTTTYSEDDAARKEELVRRVAAAQRPALVWDLGCNEGVHARAAAEHAGFVVAVDADEAVVERLYRRLRDEAAGRILPLCVDLVDPSPGLGWRGRERLPLEARGRPDLVLALALLHHVSITGNVPVAAFLDWLRSLGARAVVEFATRDDPMVRRLLRRKREDDHPDYDREWYERCLRERFEVEETLELGDGTRVMHVVRPRG